MSQGNIEVIKPLSSPSTIRKSLDELLKDNYILQFRQPPICTVNSADGFHRALQAYRSGGLYRNTITDTQQLTFFASVPTGKVRGFRGVVITLAKNYENEFVEKYGASYTLPQKEN